MSFQDARGPKEPPEHLALCKSRKAAIREAFFEKKIDLIRALPKRGGVDSKPNGLGHFLKHIVGSQMCRKGCFVAIFPSFLVSKYCKIVKVPQVA